MWATLVWAAVAVYAVWRVTHVVALFAPVARQATPPVPVEVPEDIVALALTHSEAWAQEEVVRAAREKYEELGDWNRVRAALGVGAL